jgi:lipid-binding SYLF domain-containing protein
MKWNKQMAIAGLTVISLFTITTAFASNKAEIDTGVSHTVNQFYTLNSKNQALTEKAVGVLIFPSITKAGMGIAGEYGEGSLQVNGETVEYYNIGSASIGLTLGIASRSEIIMFMTQESLDNFTKSNGWKVGVDAGIAIMSLGAGGQYDTKTLQKPILGFVFGEKGLIGDLSFEGSKITRMDMSLSKN